MSDVQELFVPKPLSASATLVASGKPCAMGGIFCSTVTGSPTCQITDGDDVNVVSAFVMSPGTYYPLPGRNASGLKVVISGTCAITAYYLN